MAKRKTDAQSASIQARAREEGTGIGLMLWLAAGNELISPWWSKQRDSELRTANCGASGARWTTSPAPSTRWSAG